MSHTVIIFQEEAVLAAVGKEGSRPELQEVYKEDLKGYGDSFTRWKQALEALQNRMDLSHVRLVLPASMCSTKTITLPYAKGRELAAMAGREMQDMFKSEIRDFSVIQADRKRGVSLCCGSVDEPVLQQFLKMCEEMEVGVDSITVPMEAYNRALTGIRAAEEQTAIFLFFEDGGVMSVMTSGGHYVYSSRSRLFAEPGTLDFGTEIVRNISGILQFNSASKTEYKITNVYYAGCPESDFSVSVPGINGMNLEAAPMGIPNGVKIHAKSGDLSVWNVCVGAMMCGVRGLHDMDLLKNYQQQEEQKEEKKTGLWKHLIPIEITFIVCALVFLGFFLWNLHLQRQIDEKNDWMNSDLVVSQYEQAQELTAQLEEVNQGISSLSDLTGNLTTYPQMDESVLTTIENAGGQSISLDIRGYDVTTGILNFNAVSRDVIDIPSYVLQLQQTGLFYSVDYTGYVYGDNGYTLSLSCIMLGTAQEE